MNNHTFIPLSQVQLGIYAECAGHENEVYYQLPYLYTLAPDIDTERLKVAVQAMFEAHPVFFSHLCNNENGEPVLQMMPQKPLNIPIDTITDISKELDRLVYPMQLNGGDLFHVNILKSPDHVYLFLDIHHIVCDGTTLKFIISDIENAYEGKAVAPETFTLADFTNEEVAGRLTESYAKAKQWYLSTFDCSDVDTRLLPDSNDKETGERRIERILDIDLADVDNFCKTKGVFKSNLFTAAYSVLLAKTAGEEESVFTTV